MIPLRHISRFFLRTLLLVLIPLSADADYEGTRITSKDGTVSLLVPRDWTVDSVPFRTGIVMTLISPYRAPGDADKIFINRDTLGPLHRFADYVRITTNQAHSMYSGKKLSESQTSIGGISAHKVVSRLVMQGSPAIVVGYFIPANDQVYTVNLITAEDNYRRSEAFLNEVCMSFRISPTKNSELTSHQHPKNAANPSLNRTSNSGPRLRRHPPLAAGYLER